MIQVLFVTTDPALTGQDTVDVPLVVSTVPLPAVPPDGARVDLPELDRPLRAGGSRWVITDRGLDHVKVTVMAR